ncbi:MAG: flagellar hook-length control protein FliK [Candidatus Brocadiia bacterium]|jgi:flagellar hook-length control protein FliK
MDRVATMLRQTPQAKTPQNSSTAVKTAAGDAASGGENFSTALAALRQSGSASRASGADAKPGADPQAASVTPNAAAPSQSGAATPQLPPVQSAAQTAAEALAAEDSGSADARSATVAPATADAPQPTDEPGAPSPKSAPGTKDSKNADAQSAAAANSAAQLTQATDAQTAEVAACSNWIESAPAPQDSNSADAPSAAAAATQAAPSQPAAPNARRAVAAAIAQETELTTLDTSDLSGAKKAAAASSATETPEQLARPSDPVSSPHAAADPAPASEVRAEAVALPNQAGLAVAPAAPERAAQSANPASAGSPRAETPDPSLAEDTVQSSVKTIAGAAEDAATRAFSALMNDATTGTHKLLQGFTADAQGQSLTAAHSAAGASAAAGVGASQEKAAPAQTNAPAEPKNFLENIVRQTRLLTRPDGASELTLSLQPSELGSVTVRLTLKAGHLDGRLQVDNQSARESLESVLPRVKQALAGEGIDLDRLEVAVRGDGSSRQGGQDSARSRQASQAGSRLSGDDMTIAAPVGASAALAGRSAAATGTMDFIV